MIKIVTINGCIEISRDDHLPSLYAFNSWRIIKYINLGGTTDFVDLLILGTRASCQIRCYGVDSSNASGNGMTEIFASVNNQTIQKGVANKILPLGAVDLSFYYR